MDTTQRARRIAELLAPFLASEGLVPWGIDISSAGHRELLRIFIDVSPEAREVRGAAGKTAGVTVDDCAAVSRHAGYLLEVEDIMPGPYVLEVSSPGIERRFFAPGQLAGYVGREIEVTLVTPRQGRRKFQGLLIGADGESFTMTVDPGPKQTAVDFAWNEVKKARLVHRFPDEAGDPGPEHPHGRSEVTP
ncbi:MAG: ribosome maturation factor RimP [Desulfovibrio sp.]|nr:ribosome maturation factor RimP [Desulfovibrio sp.]